MNRTFKLTSLGAVDPWTMAEQGQRLAKKLHKKLIRRKRRVNEKRELLTLLRS